MVAAIHKRSRAGMLFRLRLTRRPREQIDQFARFAALFRRVAADDCSLDAVMEMIREHFLFDADKGGPNCLQLVQDVNAVAVVLDHAGDPPHLTFDTVQPLESLLFRGLRRICSVPRCHSATTLYP